MVDNFRLKVLHLSNTLYKLLSIKHLCLKHQVSLPSSCKNPELWARNTIQLLSATIFGRIFVRETGFCKDMDTIANHFLASKSNNLSFHFPVTAC